MRTKSTTGKGATLEPEELEIEKRWLLLARMDPAKFVLFYDKYYPLVHRFLFGKVLDRDLADDLTSETFLKAQRGLWKFRWMNVTFGAWLFQIARNEILLHYRRQKSIRKACDAQTPPVPDLRANPLAQLVLTEDRRFLYNLVMGLDSLSSEIFQLYYWGDFTTRQIGVILDIPEGTVKTRLNRGREDIRKSIRLRQLRMIAGSEGKDGSRAPSEPPTPGVSRREDEP